MVSQVPPEVVLSEETEMEPFTALVLVIFLQYMPVSNHRALYFKLTGISIISQ